MKYSPKVLKQLGKKPTPPKPAVAAVPARWWPLPRWVVLSLCLLLAFGATWAFFEFVVWNTLPAGLVGNWEVVDGPREYSEATFEFFRNGAMEGRLNQDGNLVLINARVKVKGDKIYSTTRRPSTGEENTQVQIIRSLTPTELVIEDTNGQQNKCDGFHRTRGRGSLITSVKKCFLLLPES